MPEHLETEEGPEKHLSKLAPASLETEEGLEKILSALALTKLENIQHERLLRKSLSKRASTQPSEDWMRDYTTLSDESCEFCDMTFATFELLQSHRGLSHRFACTEGDLVVWEKETLINHYANEHDRRFVCIVCKPIVAFKLKTMLERHDKSLHPTEDDESYLCKH